MKTAIAINDLDWPRYRIISTRPVRQGSDDWDHSLVRDDFSYMPPPRPLGMSRQHHPYTPALVLLGLSVLVFAAIGAATVAWWVMRALGAG